MSGAGSETCLADKLCSFKVITSLTQETACAGNQSRTADLFCAVLNGLALQPGRGRELVFHFIGLGQCIRLRLERR